MADGDLLYSVERWTAGDEDEKGHLIWHDGEPSDDEWSRVYMVTVDRDPDGPEGDFRNLVVNPDRPLDPPGADFSYYGEDVYDIDDLVADWEVISP